MTIVEDTLEDISLSKDAIRTKDVEKISKFFLSNSDNAPDEALSLLDAVIKSISGNSALKRSNSIEAGAPNKKARASGEATGGRSNIDNQPFKYFNDAKDSLSITLAIVLPTDMALTAFLIGKEGRHVAEICSSTNARIQIEKQNNPRAATKLVFIRGYVRATVEAYKRLNGRCMDFASRAANRVSFSTTSLVVPIESAGRIIGKGGATVQWMNKASSARIRQIDENESVKLYGREFLITGSLAERLHAVYLILRELAEDRGLPEVWKGQIPTPLGEKVASLPLNNASPALSYPAPAVAAEMSSSYHVPQTGYQGPATSTANPAYPSYSSYNDSQEYHKEYGTHPRAPDSREPQYPQWSGGMHQPSSGGYGALEGSAYPTSNSNRNAPLGSVSPSNNNVYAPVGNVPPPSSYGYNAPVGNVPPPSSYGYNAPVGSVPPTSSYGYNGPVGSVPPPNNNVYAPVGNMHPPADDGYNTGGSGRYGPGTVPYQAPPVNTQSQYGSRPSSAGPIRTPAPDYHRGSGVIETRQDFSHFSGQQYPASRDPVHSQYNGPASYDRPADQGPHHGYGGNR